MSLMLIFLRANEAVEKPNKNTSFLQPYFLLMFSLTLEISFNIYVVLVFIINIDPHYRFFNTGAHHAARATLF